MTHLHIEVPQETRFYASHEIGLVHITMEVLTNLYSSHYIKVCKTPSCGCPYKINKPREVSKNIIWVLLNVLGLPQEDILLHQIALMDSKVSSLVKKAPDHLPDKFKEQPQPWSTPSGTWYLQHKPAGRDAHCPSCFKAI